MEIWEEEFERLINALNNNEDLQYEKFLDYDDFEDNYSHNEIQENQEILIRNSIKYFRENNLRYAMIMCCECVRFHKLEPDENLDNYDCF